MPVTEQQSKCSGQLPIQWWSKAVKSVAVVEGFELLELQNKTEGIPDTTAKQ